MDERQRLISLDNDLHAEADRMLAKSGLGKILVDEGLEPVGSYSTGTMTWRDVDFERHQNSPDWKAHWQLGSRLAETGWVWRASCIDAYRDDAIPQVGFYWGLRVTDPSAGPGDRVVWKLDLWTGRAEEFARQCPDRERWQAALTDEARVDILRIKQAVCHRPEYRDTMLSVDIHAAVIDHGIRTPDAFLAWWQSRT